MLYLIDENVLIDAKRDYYPFERVPEFWDWLLYMCSEFRIKVPLEIYERLVEDKDDDLAKWMKANSSELLLSEYVDETAIEYVKEEGYGSNLSEIDILKMGNDPFLIAYALSDVTHRTVVTTEQSKPTRKKGNRHIPDVCNDLDVRCINTFKLIQILDFRTDWRNAV